MPECRLEKISPKHFRIVCGCGEFVHELRREEGGELKYESFRANKKAPKDSDPAPAPATKKKTVADEFFDDEEEAGEED